MEKAILAKTVFDDLVRRGEDPQKLRDLFDIYDYDAQPASRRSPSESVSSQPPDDTSWTRSNKGT